VRAVINSATALCLGLFLALALPLHAAEEEPSAEEPSSEPVAVGEAPLFTLGPVEYRPGRGLRLESIGGTIGGFTNIKAEDSKEFGGAFNVDNLNFFLIFDHFARFRAVAEFQFKDLFGADEDGVGTQDSSFDVRRLFGDFTVIDPLHVRVGTFLTPVGYWNLLLAPPLTWTTEPPLIVEDTLFQPTTTGVMLHGSTGVAEGQLGYALFSQVLKPLQDDVDLDPPNYTAGFRLTYDVGPRWAAGATYQGADTGEGWTHLGAVHLRWQPRRGEVLSESYVEDGSALSSLQWGTYLQGVVQVYGPFYLVGRYEHADLEAERPVNVFTLGGVWKPFPFMALKVEYRFADHKQEEESIEGFFSSFTTFF
jgi:hypothetical protein